MKSYLKKIAIFGLLIFSVSFISEIDPAFGRGKTAAAAGGGGTSNYSATVTFRDQSGDGFKSDGGGGYTHGTAGVVAQVQPAYDQQIIVNLTKARRKFSYSAVLPEATSCNGGSAPTSGWQGLSAGYFSVKGIGNMAIGSTVAQRAGFNTPAGTFKFFDPDLADSIHPYHCSQTVVVTRVSRTTWTVTTDVDPLQTYFNKFGAVSDAGSRSQLDSNSDPNVLLGNYSMPFGLTISCPTCP